MIAELLFQAPAPLRALLAGCRGQPDRIGRSQATVICFDRQVLKVSPDGEEPRREAAVLRWMAGRLPAPRVLFAGAEGDRFWLLMSRLPGKMACHPDCLSRPEALIPLLAQGLTGLWRTDPAGCPGGYDLEARLAHARRRVEAGLCDMENVQPETYGPEGFSGPEELLRWLESHRPPVDPVLSHGDFCLPNLFVDRGRVSGYLDLGMCGVADRYQDLALCWRSLKNNGSGGYGGPVYPDVDPDRLFDALGMEPDREKLRYYILLDELF